MGIYGLPYDGIKAIRAERNRLAQQEKELAAEIGRLKQAFLDTFGLGAPVVFLHERNRAFMPLVWRDMTQGRNRRIRVAVGDKDWLRAISRLEKDVQRKLLGFEESRMFLNHALGMVRYDLERVSRLEREFDAWRRLMREMNQGEGN
ncbi:MAG TPA: hypothetical protein PLE99_16150 [Candidatus Thiothrix moscowensis]|uniref:hypothetical protein n=1 Tax=unclassified Thiothrix TaxID=2636184 RepID=UPI0025FB50C5|nr:MULTISPECIES: hypothetical protein [unclassified Thiothrix]HRJ54293.1 hypothetical protein [Candidatus Thiothrix moscowensis]HRJ94519.1 hypothetical protein [Candidatus Thiothrix moscowensis]